MSNTSEYSNENVTKLASRPLMGVKVGSARFEGIRRTDFAVGVA
jgi:hypothetical protein